MFSSGHSAPPPNWAKIISDPGPVFGEQVKCKANDPSYKPRLRTAIVTARDAPAHKRFVTTLREWGIEVDETFFLGGIDKSRILQEFKPHIFFDDQLLHIEGVAGATPSAHVPFGIANEPNTELTEEA